MLLTSTGGTIEHEIPVAVETPEADASFFALMALLGIYVGVIPVSPRDAAGCRSCAGSAPAGMRVLIAFTVGLLAFLAVDAALEGARDRRRGARRRSAAPSSSSSGR